MDVIAGLLSQYHFPLPLSLFIQSYISTSGVGGVARCWSPLASVSQAPALRESSPPQQSSVGWLSAPLVPPRKHLKQITNLTLHLPNKREKTWHINTCNTTQWHQQINEVIHTMRSLIRVLWQAITPGIMHTVISDRPSTREAGRNRFFLFFPSDELLMNFKSCIWCVCLLPCQ